ncbi:formate dehydrogenase accessory protein FdhE [Shewanella corallii]|uniref:Protein FdhE homolog n=1 Tax=Shewanella corallii TaxID=560080 RepID=A0ABT0N1U0_9GAMM|nr:formate dehydrogenase accessory protein FdhE [Shewanella corallii]MCL2912404.1 formate dehydrogenase accessory protein FdhE [Shewanella corallii]
MSTATPSVTGLDPEALAKDAADVLTVIPANPGAVYSRRAARLQELADDTVLTDYFGLLRLLTRAQARLAQTSDAESLFGPQPQLQLSGSTPLSPASFDWGNFWQSGLQELISELLPLVTPSVQEVLKELATTEPEQLQTWATEMLDGRFTCVPARFSLFIWAALSLYWSHWAVNVAQVQAKVGEGHHRLCPVCGAHPIASVVREQPRQGLRYLHCSLCETQWHRVRAECTCCGDNRDIHLWAETETKAPLRIESCGSCKGYTKMLFTDINPRLEVAVDDLASMVMDQQLVEEGFHPSTVNPLLLAHEEPLAGEEPLASEDQKPAANA